MRNIPLHKTMNYLIVRQVGRYSVLRNTELGRINANNCINPNVVKATMMPLYIDAKV